MCHTLQEAEQNGAKSKSSGKSTCLFTFLKLMPALKRNEEYCINSCAQVRAESSCTTEA